MEDPRRLAAGTGPWMDHFDHRECSVSRAFGGGFLNGVKRKRSRLSCGRQASTKQPVHPLLLFEVAAHQFQKTRRRADVLVNRVPGFVLTDSFRAGNIRHRLFDFE
jgi:hypothetical protein